MLNLKERWDIIEGKERRSVLDSARIYRFIALVAMTALCIGSIQVQGAFALPRPSAADAGKDAGPQIYAASAIVYCENTGEVVYAKESNTQQAPFSLVKLVTALVVVQTTPLDKKVKVSGKAASQTGTVMGLKKGEKITVEQLLYGMLMVSGNDAAYALSECVSGKKPGKCVKKMNKMARNLGCKNTKFTNPAGLKEAGTYTTARDFLKILRVALSNETIEKISGTKRHQVPATNKSGSRNLVTTVPMLRAKDSGIYAGKGGVWSETEATLAEGYKKNGLHLYIVLLGDTDAQRWDDVRTLTAYAEQNVQGIKVVEADKAVGKVRVRHGARTSLEAYTANDGYAYLPEEGSAELIRHNVTMKEITAPVKKGDVVGYYNIRIGDEVINRVPLVAKENVNVGWPPSYIGISNRLTVILAVMLGVILLLVLCVLVLRFRNRRRRKRQRRKMIREQAFREMQEEEDHRKRQWEFRQ